MFFKSTANKGICVHFNLNGDTINSVVNGTLTSDIAVAELKHRKYLLLNILKTAEFLEWTCILFIFRTVNYQFWGYEVVNF